MELDITDLKHGDKRILYLRWSARLLIFLRGKIIINYKTKPSEVQER